MTANEPDKKYIDQATLAVAQVIGERQKKVAYQAILDDLLMENFAQRYLRERANRVGIGAFTRLADLVIEGLQRWNLRK